MLLHTHSRHCTRWPRAVTSSLVKLTWEGSWWGAQSRLKEEKITTDFSQHGRQRMRGRDCKTHTHTRGDKEADKYNRLADRPTKKTWDVVYHSFSLHPVLLYPESHGQHDQLEKSHERFNCEIYLVKTSFYPHVSLAGHDFRTGLRLQLGKTEYQTTHARTYKDATPYLTQL